VSRAVALALVLTTSVAAAEPRESFDASYLYDDGAVPFFWLPLTLGVSLDPFTPARDSPFGFASEEGGAKRGSWEVPVWAVSAMGLGAATGIYASGDDASLYHGKGLAQSLATTLFLTNLGKVAIGRRRPYWSRDLKDPDAQRSFPSGHSSQAFAIATYSILFLRGRVFDDPSSPGAFAAYGGIGAAAFALAAERVLHNRHHPTDVLIGGLIGIASSLVFYRYQDWNYDEAREAALTMSR
jgi:membrane-associated phospholipid phosphatase